MRSVIDYSQNNVFAGNILSGCSFAGLLIQDNSTWDLSVSNNTFANNPTQVSIVSNFETYDPSQSPHLKTRITPIEHITTILADNDYDRAVVIRGSGIQIPTIYSIIQAGINAAAAGQTVDASAGLYLEDLKISKNLTLQGPKAATARNTGSATDWTSATTATWTGTDAQTAGEAVIRSAAVTVDAVVDIAEDCNVTIQGLVIEARNRTDSTNAHLIYAEGKNMTIQSVNVINNIIGPITGTAQDGNKGRFGLVFDSQIGGPNGLSGLVQGNKIFGAEGNGANVFIAGQHYYPSMADYSGMLIENNDVYGANRAGMEFAGGISGLKVLSNAVLYNGLIWNGTAYVQSTRSLATPDNILFGIGINLIRTGTTSAATLDKQNYIENLTLSGNTIQYNEKMGLYTEAMQRNLTVTGNTITDNGRGAIWIDESGTYNVAKAYHEAYGYFDGGTISGNTLSGSGTYAAMTVTGKPAGLQVVQNVLPANSTGIVQVDGAGQDWAYTLAAPSNYWGHANGPKSDSNPLNASTDGAIAGDTVAYFPWALDNALTAYVTRSSYGFNYTLAGFVMNEEQSVPIEFGAASTPGQIGYAAVRFAFAASGPGDVTFKATDTQPVEHTFVNSGYWGPASGFPLSANHTATTPFKLTFAKPGEYTINFSVFEMGHESTPIASGSQTVTVAKATPIITWPTSATGITYGDTLVVSTLANDGSASHVGTAVAGSFAFTTPATKPNAGTALQSVTFTPSDANYNPVVGSVSVTVAKATPFVTWPTAADITYGDTLAAASFSGGSAQHSETQGDAVAGSFAFTDPAIAPVAGTADQAVTFTPSDTDNYNSVEANISVTVNKSTTSVTTWPTASVILLGQSIGDAVLSGGVASVPGTFSFDAPTAKPAVGTASYAVTFTPTDTSINTIAGTVDVTVARSTVVWVDDDFTSTTVGWGVTNFVTIQGAVDAVAAAGTVNVADGTYVEDIEIGKPMTLLGPNAGVDPNTNSVSRVAEAVLIPATSAPDPDGDEITVITYITCDQVCIDGFTLDGNNPSIESGIDVNGIDVDACTAIDFSKNISKISIRNNIIKNISSFAIDLCNYKHYGEATTDNAVTGNLIQNIGHIPYGWGIGVLVYDNCYVDISRNVIKNVRIGIQTGNWTEVNPNGVCMMISNNDISAIRMGIWHNEAYRTASAYPINIVNNKITAIAADPVSKFDGMFISSMDAEVTTLIQDNTIDGSQCGGLATGYNVYCTRLGSFIDIKGGQVSGVDYGLWANNWEGYNSPAVWGAHVTLSNVDISAKEVGVLVWDSPNSTTHEEVAVTIEAGVLIRDGVQGIKIAGANAKVTGISNTAMAGQTGDFITISSDAMAGVELNATIATFGGKLGSDMDLSELLAIEDKITHKLDNTTLGLVRVKADNVYVTEASGSIQRGIDAAAADDTVNVAAGTFSVGANVTKSLTLLGANAGIDGSGTRGAESVIDGNDAVSPTDIAFKVCQPNLTVVIDGFMMTDCSPLDENFQGTAPHTTDITFKNNLISSATAIQCGNGGNTCWRNVTVANNKFMDIDMEAQSSAIVLNGCDRATVTDNVFLRMAYNAVQLNGVATVVVSRNSIDTTQEQAIQLSGVVASGLISDNVILNANVLAKADKGGIRLYGSQFTGPVEITGNIISGSYNGIAIKSGENITGKQITISNNNLEGNSNAGIYHGGTGELSAERNWWGSTTGPVNGTNPGGSGAIVSDNVDFSPWLGDGTDTDLAAIGFQPDLTTVYYKPALLVFAQQPGGAALGMALNPQPTVKVLDDNGQIATQFVGTVSLSISSNPGFGQLGGTIDMLATAGVVSFNNVSIANDGGAGYKLKATVGNLTVESDAFTISNPNPVLSSMDPIFIAKGSAAFTLTVSGSDFVPSSTVMWNGSSRATTYLSASQLTAAITAADVATAGTAQISVASPTATTSGELTFTITETALAPVVYVNGTWSGPADCGTERVWEYDAFRTIQSGVNGVMANGTVNVLAGTYTETVAVSKIIDILGEIDVTGAALPSILGTIFVDVPTTPDAASRIENLKFTVTADDCLKLKSVDGGVTVKNCTFDGAGKFMSGGKVGINFITGGNGNKNIAILGCQFINGLYVSVQGRVDGLTVRNSEFINVKSGLNIPYIGNVVVEDCDISVIAQGVDNDTYGIRFATTGALNASNMRLAGCRINVDKNALVAGAGTYHSAIIVRSGAGGTLAVVNCSIDGEVVNESATVLDASGNWWGSVLPADVKMAANNGALVDYSPWLAVGTDTDEGAVGFKGDYATLWVDDDSPQVGMIGRIQEGVYLTTDAGTVKVAAGIYLESNIVVAKGVTVEGAGSTRSDVLIAPAAEDGNADNAFANNAQNGFIIKAHNVTIRNLTLHGQGNAELTAAKNNFRSGIVTADASYPGGGGTWNNLHVDNVHILYPYRRGISVWPAQVSGTLIENSRIEQVGLNHGISMAGQGQVLNNTIVRAFQGIVVGPDASTPAGLVKINGNTLSEIGNYPGCWGYNAGTGVYSGQPRAIQFNNSDSAGRPVEILNNIITDNGLEAYSGTVGIYTRLANSDSFVEGNIITLSSGVSWAEPGSQSVGMLLGWSYANGFTVRGNRVNSTKYGIGMMVFGNGTAEKPLHIECNELTSTASAALDTGDGTGIYIANQYLFASDKSPTYVNLSSNIVSGYVTAISVEKISTSDKTLTVVASYNDLSGNTKGISSTGGADIVTDAMLNWWGSAQGPAHGSNPGGNGVIVTDSIDFSPWLGDGEDTSTDIGFQPNLAPVYYLPVGLEFTVQPADAFLGAALSQVEVTVKNAIGEIATQFNGSIALAIGTNPGEPVAGELAGTKSVVVQSGVATFADLAIIKGTGNGYTLKASTAELPTATSADFNIENSTPVLTDVADWTTDEQSAPSTFTAQATDTAADLVAQTLTFSLVCTSESAMPEGISFNTATGAFSWQTIESQGGKSYTFTLTVTDNGSGALYAADTFTVTVNEVNAAPTLLLDPTGNEKTIDEEQTLTFTAVGADQDEPTQTLTYTLAAVDGENYPAGATLGLLDGAFSWTPGEEQGGATYVVDVVVTDNGKNPDNLSATQRVTIEVAEVNVAPVLESVLPQSVNFGDTLTFTASATDQDLPAQTLTFSMTGAPAGATLDSSSGAFSWTPTEAQAQASYSFELTVTDSGTNPDNLFDTKTVTIGAVAAMQSCPGFRSPSDSMVVSNTLAFGTDTTSLSWTPVLPTDWAVNAVNTLGNGEAAVDVSGAIVYSVMPASPAAFTYTVSVPGNAGVSNSLSAVVSFNGLTAEVAAMPIYRYHSADYRRDTGGEFAGQFRKIDSAEVNRVLAYWRAGGYKPDSAGADGFTAAAGYVGTGGHHSADHNNNWVVDTDEAAIVQEYWRAGGYHVDPNGEDGSYASTREGSGPSPLNTLSMLAMAMEPTVSLSELTTYNPGQSLTLTTTFQNNTSAKLLRFIWRLHVPDGWKVTGISGDGSPELDLTGTNVLLNAPVLPTSQIKLVLTVSVPLNETRPCCVGSTASYKFEGMSKIASLAASNDGVAIIPLDSNGNGLADSWATTYGITDPSDDADSDGMSNLAEYLCGTIPTDAASYLRMVNVKPLPGTGVEVSWSSEMGRTYILQRAQGKPADFTEFKTGLVADPSGLNSYVDESGLEVPSFYRVKLQQ
ncbi:MAG: right-handed parallel beta-helix repeat-containing protein [Kiritimatiellae bacterium]|nr:right-handed parallel beta-helix repeat-containing protein [Kiritimatiellia bacterium]